MDCGGEMYLNGMVGTSLVNTLGSAYFHLLSCVHPAANVMYCSTSQVTVILVLIPYSTFLVDE